MLFHSKNGDDSRFRVSSLCAPPVQLSSCPPFYATTPVKFKDNRWYFEPQKDIPGDLGSKLKFSLERLEPVEANITSLQDECEVYIGICYEGYRNWMGGCHIDRETIRRIAALGAEVDLDLYAYGECSLPYS